MKQQHPLYVNLLIPFVFLISSLFRITKEYIFDFNPTNSLLVFPFILSFILSITLLLTESKTYELSGWSLKPNKLLFS